MDPSEKSKMMPLGFFDDRLIRLSASWRPEAMSLSHPSVVSGKIFFPPTTLFSFV
jgi:hypothetical protein